MIEMMVTMMYKNNEINFRYNQPENRVVSLFENISRKEESTLRKLCNTPGGLMGNGDTTANCKTGKYSHYRGETGNHIARLS